MSLPRVFGGLVQLVVTVGVLVVLAVVAFFVTVFVVSTGAELAGYDPSDDFVVLSASLLVVAALLGGIPLGHTREPEHPEDDDALGFQ